MKKITALFLLLMFILIGCKQPSKPSNTQSEAISDSASQNATSSNEQETNDPYGLHDISDERITVSENKKTFNGLSISLSVPADWKCMVRNGEDGGYYFFQNPTLGEKCQLILSITGSEYLNNRTEDEYLTYLTDTEKGHDVKINTFTKEKLDGYDGRKVVYTYKSENTEFIGIDYNNIVVGARLYDFSITYPASESETYDDIFKSIIDSVKFKTIESNGSNTTASSQETSRDTKKIGIISLGYYENYNQYVEKIKSSQYLSEYAFLKELKKEEFISASDGTQTFAIIPDETVKSISVYKLKYDENQNKTQNGDLLYNSPKANPIVLKCNLSDIHPDANIVIVNQDGTVTEFSPQISMKDGKLEIISNSEHLIKDLTKY